MSRRISFPKSERGAALMTVLLLVSVLSVIAALMLERSTLATRLAVNGADRETARWQAIGIESLVLQEIANLNLQNGRLPPIGIAPDGIQQQLPFERGAAQITVRDGATCFNINSLVTGQQGRLASNPAAMEQFARLANVVQIDQRQAESLAAAIADWIDSDQQENPGGGEDGFYLREDEPHRTGGQLIYDIGELRAIRGMDEVLFDRLRPWLCALPAAEMSELNINQLRQDQFPLIAMLLPPEYPVSRVREILATRPPQGFSSVFNFWQTVESGQNEISSDVQQQAVLDTRWYALETRVTIGDALLKERALVDGRLDPPRVVWRVWDGD
ncbi:type II secretion system minor pseudopilin GspK [Alterisphingorhabdus coralli]|uniref:Type II secretion system protein K n=1 Tax=Alterisphingorhabdus coralli TaxID=3071408 RepID=A0AA97F881_9SPHN|nr:type II secretion system minor pseudopilin GspK [Parasphingorhabdus sp. SCSIO 66989]WOE74320.1 type II secretion system minor pseudopilin GspK [Parasphingorhabdus sp. SCSIO 66989]